MSCSGQIIPLNDFALVHQNMLIVHANILLTATRTLLCAANRTSSATSTMSAGPCRCSRSSSVCWLSNTGSELRRFNCSTESI